MLFPAKRCRRAAALASVALMAWCCNGEQLCAQIAVEPGLACKHREDLTTDAHAFFEVLCSENVSLGRVKSLLDLISDERPAFEDHMPGRFVTIADIAAAELRAIVHKEELDLTDKVDFEKLSQNEAATIRFINTVKELPSSEGQLDIIGKGCRHDAVRVRVAAMEALKDANDCVYSQEIHSLLTQGFQDKEPMVAIAAARSLASHGFKDDRIENLLLQFLKKEIRVGHAFAGDAVTTRDWRAYLLEVYPRMGPHTDSAQSVILELSHSDEISLRLRAKLVLGKVFDRPEQTRDVVNIAIDTEAKRGMRIEAASALTGVGYDDFTITSLLIEGARDSSGALAAILLRAAASNDSSVMGVLSEFASSDDDIVAAAARRLIREPQNVQSNSTTR